jgi:hypothetical protein
MNYSENGDRAKQACFAIFIILDDAWHHLEWRRFPVFPRLAMSYGVHSITL